MANQSLASCDLQMHCITIFMWQILPDLIGWLAIHKISEPTKTRYDQKSRRNR